MLRRLLLCLVCLLAACGDDADRGGPAPTDPPTTGACGEVEAKPLDPGSGQHLLPGAAEPTYNSDPPTSGPHSPGDHPTGVVNVPLARPVQVSLLEHGEVLVQYGDVAAIERYRLTRLVAPGNNVTVAPNPALPSPVVATAWEHMLRCERVDTAALRDFITTHAGKGPGH